MTRKLVARFTSTSLSACQVPLVTDQVLPPPRPVVVPKNAVLKLSKAWQDFADSKQWSEKLRCNNELLMDNLLFFLGDVPVEKITKRDLRNALEAIRGLPQRNRKPYRGESLKELSMLQIPEEHRISGKTVKEHLKLCQSLFSSYMVKEREILASSPTEGLTLEHDDNRFACLCDAQVRQILEKAKDKPEWVRWFMLLAAYSGARRSELARLTTGTSGCAPTPGETTS